MAHNIEEFADGSSAFFSAREVAWHKLGTITPDALTSSDALKTAQLDWPVKVSENPISTTVDGKTVTLQDKYLTYRNHSKAGLTALGVVGNRYTPIQNLEAFDFLNHIADESGAVFETAGSLNGGARVFVTMKFPESMKLASGTDVIDNYIMAVNSHDGSSSFTVAVTPIRAVCTNTVRLALNSAVSKISLKHTAGASAKVQQARETLGIVFKYQEAFEQEVEQMLSEKFTDAQYKKFIEVLVPEPKGELSTRAENSFEQKRGELMALWKAPTQSNIAGTKWAAYNAVAEWSDWAKPVRSKEGKDEVRAERLILGNGEKFKNKAQLILTA
jgi:phage/plasmid-like protein (TIGR03299 family)